MATYYNPKIITNNIEFSVDAANVKSWSGASSLGTKYINEIYTKLWIE